MAQAKVVATFARRRDAAPTRPKPPIISAHAAGSGTAVTALSSVVELVAPTVIGLAVLGDRVPDGHWPLVGTGFALALAGTIWLARFVHDDQPAGAGVG